MGWDEALKVLPEVAGEADALPPEAIDGGRVHDPSQDEIIRDRISARQIVEAGPGFGKTEVACARVAWLLAQGVAPASILLLSFTRTAVREMRSRIKALADQGVDVAGVEIRTLDSFAWRLRSGLTETAMDHRNGSHEESIRALIGLLSQPGSQALDYLESFDHVFIDEAQDLVGPRVELIFVVLSRLRDDCGYTIFLDPAQAIYDWTEDGAAPEGDVLKFRDSLSVLRPAPKRRKLRRLHRARDPRLRHLLLGARDVVLDEQDRDRHGRVRQVLGHLAQGRGQPDEICSVVESLGEETEHSLALFRTRGQVLEASSWLAGKGIAHRLRFGALPQVAAPWIAWTLNRAWERRRRPVLRRADFDAAWQESAGLWLCQGWAADAAWALLRRMGGADLGDVDVRRVADRLAMAQLPDEVFLKEIGPSGPILGTVHGSKGREAHTVVMHLCPPRNDEHEDPDQEARVLYVALSRARERLVVQKRTAPRWFYLESGRVWRVARSQVQIEVGREGDIDHLHTMAAAGPAAAWEQQQALARFDGSIIDLNGAYDPDDQFRWKFWPSSPDGGSSTVIATLRPSFNYDLWQTMTGSDGTKLSPGREMRWIRWFDLTSVGLSADSEALSRLPEPFRSTRLVLAPVISGMGLVARRPRRNDDLYPSSTSTSAASPASAWTFKR